MPVVFFIYSKNANHGGEKMNKKVVPMNNSLVGVQLDPKLLKGLVVKGVKPVRLARTALVTKFELEAMPKRMQEDYEYDKNTNSYRVVDYIWAQNWRKHGPYYYNPTSKHYIRTAIGGSDIAVGYDGSDLEKSCLIKLYEGQHGSNFKSVMELVAEKQERQMTKIDSGAGDVFFIGHLEEETIRQRALVWWQNKHPLDIVDVENDTWMYQCGYKNEDKSLKYPWMLCNMDGTITINGIKGVFEAKTCQFSSPDLVLWKNGIVPLKYYLQCVYYMACANLPFAVICCKWGIGAEDFICITIIRDFEVENAVLALGQDIVDQIESGNEPEYRAQNPELLLSYYRRRFGGYRPDAEPKQIDEKFVDYAKAIMEFDKEMKELDSRMKEIKKIKQEMLSEIIAESGDTNCAYVDSGEEGIWYQLELRKKKADRYLVDEEKVKELYPDLYQRYQKTTFDTTTFAKENKNLIGVVKKDVLTEADLSKCEVKYVSDTDAYKALGMEELCMTA